MAHPVVTRRMSEASAAAGPSGWGRVAAAIAWRESHTLFPLHDATRHQLRLGLCSSLSSGHLRNVIRHILDRPSPPELSFVEGSVYQALHAARRRDVDVAFVYGEHPWEHLDHEVLWREPVWAAMAESHPLASGADVHAERLAQDVILVRGSPADHCHQAALVRQAIGVTPSRLSCHAADRETLVELAGLGLGVTLVCESSLGAFHPGVVYRPICGAAEAVPFSAVWKPGGGNPELGPLLATARASRPRPGVSTLREDSE
jgi:DNA-binding transcriptional LysR family regulator